MPRIGLKLNAPSVPLAGKHMARFSAVLTRDAGGWQIASFHNTVAPEGADPSIPAQESNCCSFLAELDSDQS